ncbi:hypothetical protein Lesp01_52440 [Lentzea sp. NBRC 102530]|nr:hypothetical protein Lesp01_52440 [Lentzea sp. NBRC 102530]
MKRGMAVKSKVVASIVAVLSVLVAAPAQAEVPLVDVVGYMRNNNGRCLDVETVNGVSVPG